MGDPIAELLDRYERLDSGPPIEANGHGISGWQCINPYAKPLVSAVARRSLAFDRVPYLYLEDDERLKRDLARVQFRLDGSEPGAVFCGAGANSLLYTFVAQLQRRGIEEIFYIPPLYFSIHFALSQFRIRARPISSLQAFEIGFAMNLPEKSSVLLLTDPIWYAGISVPQSVVDEIISWQRRTQSTILVDGSFQYMPWNGRPNEATSALDPALTFRVIAPTKMLAVHGYRFAYVLLPHTARAEFASTYSQIYGSAGADSISFGHEAVRYLGSRSITKKLMLLAAHQHKALRAKNIIESILEPDRGFFVFEKLKARPSDNRGIMTCEMFEQRRFPDYVRINLLSPAIARIVGT